MSVIRGGKYLLKTKAGKKLLSRAEKLIKKKKYATEYRKQFKSTHLDKLYVHGARTTAKYKFKQKPVSGGGIEIKTQKGTHYGIKGIMHKMHPKGVGAIIRRMPYVGARESWSAEMSRMYGGVHMAQDPASVKKSMGLLLRGYKKRKKIKKAEGGPVKLLKGALLTKGIRKGFKIFKKETPQVFSKMKRSRLQLKTDTKKLKTPELTPLGVTKVKPDDLRKLVISEGLKHKIKKQAKIVLKHNRKAMPLLWSKAKSLTQVYKLDKYNKFKTKDKLDILHKDFKNLESYINRIKSKSATKHSHGGEVTIGNNVDRSLL